MTADVISAALMSGVVNGLKYTVKRERPNQRKNNSFPSGHTATAFMAATMLYKEYKDLSPWVGIGAYSAATLVDDEQPPLAVGCVGWSRYRYHVNGSRLSFI